MTDERPAGSGEDSLDADDERLEEALRELEEEFAEPYILGRTAYCAMCDYPLDCCMCFTDAPPEEDVDG